MNLKQLINQSIIWRGLYFISLFAVNICLSRLLAAEQAGVVFYITTILGFLFLILNFSVDSSITFFNANKSITTSKLLTFSLGWTIIIAVVVYIFSPFLWKIFPIQLIDDIEKNRFTFFYIIGLLLTYNQVSLFYSTSNFATPNIILTILNIVLMILFYFNYTQGNNNGYLIHDYFLFHLIQGIFVTAIFIQKNIRICKIELPNKQEFLSIFKFASISLLANIIFYIVYKLDIIFVKQWCLNPLDLGNYTQANKLSQMMLIVPQIIASSIFPATASSTNNIEIVHQIKKYTTLFAVAITILIVTMLIFGEQLITLIFGESFKSTALVITILLPGIFCLMISTLLSAYLAGKKQNKYNLYAATIAVVTMLVATFLSKSFYSIFIAATISSLAYFAESFFCFIQFCKLEKLWIYKQKSLISEA